MAPTVCIVVVLKWKSVLGELERTKGINHYGEFFSSFLTDRTLVHPWVRTVWDTARMNGNRRPLNAFARHKVPLNVVDDFIRIDVGVIVGSWNRQGVIIEESRHEGTQDKSGPVKGLMHWRGLVNPTSDRFKVFDVERKRPEMTIPTNHV